MTAPPTHLAEAVERVLVCPKCKCRLCTRKAVVQCELCGQVGGINEGIITLRPITEESYFDDTFAMMDDGKRDQGSWAFYYERQVTLLKRYLRPGTQVLDVGCGSSSPYGPTNGAYVVGIEASLQAIRANADVDMPIFGSATEIPLASNTVDVVICFYSLHHITGRTTRENRMLVEKCLTECARVLKPGGVCFVAENTAPRMISMVQTAIWNAVKRLIPRQLDMYFWSVAALLRLGEKAFPGSKAMVIAPTASPFALIRPIFALPRFKIFAFMYPLKNKVLVWTKGIEERAPATMKQHLALQ